MGNKHTLRITINRFQRLSAILITTSLFVPQSLCLFVSKSLSLNLETVSKTDHSDKPLGWIECPFIVPLESDIIDFQPE
jgi:hypothetical protein